MLQGQSKSPGEESLFGQISNARMYAPMKRLALMPQTVANVLKSKIETYGGMNRWCELLLPKVSAVLSILPAASSRIVDTSHNAVIQCMGKSRSVLYA